MRGQFSLSSKEYVLGVGRGVWPDSRHQTDDHTGACQRSRVATAAFLLFGRYRCERSGVAHVVPGALDLAVGTLDVRDAELVDVAVEGIGDAAHMPSDAKGS